MRRRRFDIGLFRIGLLLTLLIVGGLACAFLGTGDQSLNLATSPSPNQFVITGQATGDEITALQMTSTGSPEPPITPQEGIASDFVWLPGNREIMLTTENEIHALGITPGAAPSDLMPRTGYMSAQNPSLLSVARDKAIVAWANDERVISVWQASPNSQVTIVDESKTPVTGLAFSAQGDLLAYSAYDQKLVVWDVDEDQKLSSWQAPSWLANLSYSPDSLQLGGADLANFIVYIFNSETGVVERTLQWSEDANPALYGVFFSPDWRYLAWVARNTVQIMYVANGELRSRFVHEDSINTVAWSPDNRLLAVGAAGTVGDAFGPEVKIWDVESSQLVATLSQRAPVVSLSFSPDGNQLGILDSGGEFRIWPLK